MQMFEKVSEETMNVNVDDKVISWFKFDLLIIKIIYFCIKGSCCPIISLIIEDKVKTHLYTN